MMCDLAMGCVSILYIQFCVVGWCRRTGSHAHFFSWCLGPNEQNWVQSCSGIMPLQPTDSNVMGKNISSDACMPIGSICRCYKGWGSVRNCACVCCISWIVWCFISLAVLQVLCVYIVWVRLIMLAVLQGRRLKEWRIMGVGLRAVQGCGSFSQNRTVAETGSIAAGEVVEQWESG